MIRKAVGERVKELRTKKGLSQEKFSLEVGLDRTYIASIEGGQRNVSIITLSRIWNSLGITAKQFFDSKLFK